MSWKNKRCLVTGAGGFIGSHLVERLLHEGAEVKAFLLYNSFNSWGWLDAFPRNQLKKIDVFCGDIRDPNGVRKAMEGVEFVFHLAALIGVPYSYHSPDSYIDTNVKGALNVLQAAMQSHPRRVIVASTSEVYGSACCVPIDEKHPLCGQSPYSASKIGADKLSESFFRSFALPVTIVRPFNTYGPRQSARAVIPTIIIQLINNSRKIKLGSLTSTRDFNYVTDVVRGFLEIAGSAHTVGQEINIAAQQEISIESLAKELILMINPAVRIEFDKKRLRPKNSEVTRLLGCNEKIRQLTGWEPRYSLRQGLLETVRWFKSNLGKYKAQLYNI